MAEPVTFSIKALDHASDELKLIYALDQCMQLFQIDCNEKSRAAQWLSDKYQFSKLT